MNKLLLALLATDRGSLHEQPMIRQADESSYAALHRSISAFFSHIERTPSDSNRFEAPRFERPGYVFVASAIGGCEGGVGATIFREIGA